MWSFRLNQEMKVSATAHFVTLTYSDEHVPYLDKETGELEGLFPFQKTNTILPRCTIIFKKITQIRA